MKYDAYFTPAAVGDRLVSTVSSAPRRVLDPAAGDGALLLAARRRWPDVEIHAVDIDGRQVSSLRLSMSGHVGKCDFLSAQSRRSSPVLSSLVGAVDLVVINPPYSTRGAQTWPADVNGVGLRCSRAMAFVISAFPYLQAEGEVAALLPSSVLTSRRDSVAWTLVKKIAEVEVMETFPRGTFSVGTASAVAVRISLGASSGADRNRAQTAIPGPLIRARVHRGRLPVHLADRVSGGSAGAVPFVHTTHLWDGEVRCSDSVRGAQAIELGPSVLLPRVGKPIPGKVALWRGGTVALSDCVFAVEAPSDVAAETVAARILANWGRIESGYGGSCARYLTLAHLIPILEGLGVCASWTGKLGWLSPSPIGVQRDG